MEFEGARIDNLNERVFSQNGCTADHEKMLRDLQANVGKMPHEKPISIACGKCRTVIYNPGTDNKFVQFKIDDTEKKFKELKDAAAPLMKYLAENHYPHITVLVTSTHCQLVEGLISLNTMEFVEPDRTGEIRYDYARGGKKA